MRVAAGARARCQCSGGAGRCRASMLDAWGWPAVRRAGRQCQSWAARAHENGQPDFGGRRSRPMRRRGVFASSVAISRAFAAICRGVRACVRGGLACRARGWRARASRAGGHRVHTSSFLHSGVTQAVNVREHVKHLSLNGAHIPTPRGAAAPPHGRGGRARSRKLPDRIAAEEPRG